MVPLVPATASNGSCTEAGLRTNAGSSIIAGVAAGRGLAMTKKQLPRTDAAKRIGGAVVNGVLVGERTAPAGAAPAKKIEAGNRADTDLCFLAAWELAGMIRGKKVSAREVMAAHLKQIERVNPKVNAIVTLVGDQAMEQARQADEAQARGIRVRVRLSAASCPAVHGNAAELREALANLLNNAFDAMPRGGSVVIWTGVVQGHAAIRVRDTGTGMTEEVRQRALEPFFTTKAERGTGLGLATANSIVRRHEGHLGIDSSLGSGTTITILLPVRESSEPEPTRPTTPPSQPLRVLVVDDDERLAKILCRFLRADGHQVTVAGCGPAGLAMLEELARAGERVDVVFTDWSMEGVHGRDLARRARTLFPQARVVLVTGWGEGVEEGLEAEVNGVLSKPFGLETVRRVLGGG